MEQKKKEPCWLRRESGATFAVVAVTMAVLLGFSALVLDMGSLYLEKSGLQNALDAAALAGAEDLPDTDDAAATAQSYFISNGFGAGDLTVTFPDSSTITCSGSMEVQTSFGRVLGVNRLSTQQLHATAVKTNRKIKSPFDYGVFQGESNRLLDLGGSAFTIKGSVFSNGAFRCKPSGTTTIDGLETVSESAPDILGCVSIGSVTKGVDPVAMVNMQPHFDALKDAAMAGHTFTTASSTQVSTWKKAWQPFTISGYNIVEGDFRTSTLCCIDGVLIVKGNYVSSAGIQINSGGVLIVYGNLSWGGYNGNLPLFQNSLIYVTGNISASPGGSGTTFTGPNSVYAGGDITFGGSGISTTGSNFFYCQNGDLTVTANCSSIYMSGILYSYNGSIVLESHPNIYGAVIGRYIDSYPGGLLIDYPDEGLGYSQTKEACKLID